MDDLIKACDNITIGDKIVVCGRDEYKGWNGTVVQLIKGLQEIYVIELEATQKKIERKKNQIVKK